MPLAFSEQSFVRLPPQSWSLRWWGAFFADPSWLRALLTSLEVAALSCLLSVGAGTSAALGLTRLRPRLRAARRRLSSSARMVAPVIVLAVGLYALARAVGLVGSTLGLVLAHTMLALPYVVLNVGVSVAALDPRLALAASGLGAAPWRVFRTVTLPAILPGMLGGGIFAFVTSFDEVVLAVFLAGPSVKTLPVRIWEEVRVEYTPIVAVAATIMLVLALLGSLMGRLAAREDGMSAVALRGIAKRFGAFEALAPLDLEIASGEFVSFLGPSGSGKTTLLNICAGYLEPTAGQLLVAGRDITALPAAAAQYRHGVPELRAVSASRRVRERRLWPAGRARSPAPSSSAGSRRRCGACASTISAKRSVRSLSGGQQQRVALARAMVIEPDILLMDEPLGALDKQLRKDVQIEIRRMHVAHPRTTLYVTHDQEEALVMSDRIAVMRGGRVVQLGTAQELYSRPVDSFVARFLGESNLVAGPCGAARAMVRRRSRSTAPQPIEGCARRG